MRVVFVDVVVEEEVVVVVVEVVAVVAADVAGDGAVAVDVVFLSIRSLPLEFNFGNGT